MIREVHVVGTLIFASMATIERCTNTVIEVTEMLRVVGMFRDIIGFIDEYDYHRIHWLVRRLTLASIKGRALQNIDREMLEVRGILARLVTNLRDDLDDAACAVSQ